MHDDVINFNFTYLFIAAYHQICFYQSEIGSYLFKIAKKMKHFTESEKFGLEIITTVWLQLIGYWNWITYKLMW